MLICGFDAAAQLPVDPRVATNQPLISPNLVPVGAQPAMIPSARPQPGLLSEGVLAFDTDTQEYVTKPGEMEAHFVFNLTNVSPADVTINQVQTSCGCTAVQLPPLPWKLSPRATGQIPVVMNLVGKSGVLFKTVNLLTDRGNKSLLVKVTMVAPTQPMTPLDRERNQLIAKADRQGVFKGDCARCHVEPVIGKIGHDLYLTACSICHEAEHRATMVPDLRALPHDTNADYWRLMVTMGKEGTLMPAFSQKAGGPLSDYQINSLVSYLTTNFPSKGPKASAAATPASPKS